MAGTGLLKKSIFLSAWYDICNIFYLKASLIVNVLFNKTDMVIWYMYIQCNAMYGAFGCP